MRPSEQTISSHLLVETGHFPNNAELVLLNIQNVFSSNEVSADTFELLFDQNGWPAAWRNGLYDFHHYHSSAHEALGVYTGWVEACFGGPGGPVVRVEAGDAIIIPAGVSHCNVGQSPDFKVVGAYPRGQVWDMKYGRAEERPAADQSIKNVPLPTADPIFGVNGPLLSHWT